jgi:hypothetical protein
MSQRRQTPFASLEQKLRKNSASFDKLIVSPPGEAKMSEVLEEFVEPYWEFNETKKDTIRLLTLATLAWNMALLSPAQQQEMMDQVLTDEIVEGDQELKAKIQELIQELIARKNRYFSQYRRMIVDFDLKDQGNGHYYLSVASTLSAKDSDE